MIDPDEPLDVQVRRQARIIDALVQRANQQHELGGSAYSLFQSAIRLQSKVSEKTRDLEDALTTLGRASNQLETSEEERAQTQRTLQDALDTMEGGFALFAEGRLRVFNDFFKFLIPDIEESVQEGLEFSAYVEALAKSGSIRPRDGFNRFGLRRAILKLGEGPAAPFVFGLKNDRWFVITSRRTRSDNTVILQTEITAVVRGNRLEKNRLIDEQEHFLQAAFDHMPQGVATFSAEGTLLINNAQFGALLTLPIQLTAVGTSFGQIIEYLKAQAFVGELPHDDFASLIRFLRRAGNLRQRVRHISDRILDIDMHPLPDGGCIINVMDVTVEFQTTEMLEMRVMARTSELTEANVQLRRQYDEQARVEEDLRVAKAEVEAAMSSKTRFFAAASHDLLQPINAAKLLISSLTDGCGQGETRETVRRLDSSFRSIEDLLRALLDIARLESTDTSLVVTSFSLDEVLRGVVEDLGQLAVEKGLDLRVVKSGLWVRSDQRYLARSVQNFVDNAIRYTEKGRILVGCRRHGDTVTLEVWDTGIGISRSDQKRIFKEFTRVGASSRNSQGMGLGLSIVERACRLLGHPVSVRSKPGVGSVFSLTLPIVEPNPTDAVTVRSIAAHADQDMDLIILLIENDPGVAYAMTQKLESWGASVLAAKSTQEALDLVQDIGMAPDIILADFHLNGEDTGVQAILSVRDALKSPIPAIMITANHEDHVKDAGLANRFSVLTKPVNLSRLRSLIDWKTRTGSLSA
ncbi:PAS-domain containing protein [Sedimentitalea sp. JM2-8]|uniref:histidine kinase n=1 Tax=Sedimentitalea xiamensis TaxID=3050037 RepID=A0ABT7FK09_9RHOB|nr:ATP-binding protein [Sedimentitalea xiamensis]MDK3075320.1 PAS-domain containing protein [Sedimentitalea xiamensis]